MGAGKSKIRERLTIVRHKTQIKSVNVNQETISKHTDYSNNPVDINYGNFLDIRFKSQPLRVNPGNRIHPLLSAVKSLNPFQRLCVTNISEINLGG